TARFTPPEPNRAISRNAEGFVTCLCTRRGEFERARKSFGLARGKMAVVPLECDDREPAADSEDHQDNEDFDQREPAIERPPRLRLRRCAAPRGGVIRASGRPFGANAPA